MNLLSKGRTLVAISLILRLGFAGMVLAGAKTTFKGEVAAGDSLTAPVISASTTLNTADLVVTDDVSADSIGAAKVVASTSVTTADLTATDDISADSVGVAKVVASTSITTADLVATDDVSADSVGVSKVKASTYVVADSIENTGAYTVDGDLFQFPISFGAFDPDSNAIFGRFYAPYPMTVTSIDVGFRSKHATACSVFVYSDADAIVKRVSIASAATFTRDATGFNLNAAADTVYLKYWETNLANEDTLGTVTIWMHPKND